MTSERKESTGTVERCARAMAAQNDEPEMWRAYEEGARACLVALVDDEMIERAEKALFERAQDVWGWGSNEYADVAQAVRLVLHAALETPNEQ